MQPFYPEGKYKGEVVNQALGKNQKGTPQFVLKCRIASFISGEEERPVGRQYERSVFLYLSDKAAEYTLDKLKQLGFSGSSIRQLDLAQPDSHTFVGQTIDLECAYEEDQQGNQYEKWNLAYQGNGEIENITPLSAQETRKLDALFGKSLAPAAKANGKTKTTPPPAAQQQANPEITDDDIPFSFAFWFVLASAFATHLLGVFHV